MSPLWIIPVVVGCLGLTVTVVLARQAGEELGSLRRELSRLRDGAAEVEHLGRAVAALRAAVARRPHR